MKTTISDAAKRAPESNVHDLQAQRQRRSALRMAMQTIVLQYAYPYLYRFIRYS